jgi:TRAP-type transport system periplasmic protein
LTWVKTGGLHILGKYLKTALAATAMTMLVTDAAMAADVTIKLGHIANEENSWHKPRC